MWSCRSSGRVLLGMMPDREAPKLTGVSAGPLAGGADGEWSVRCAERFLER